MDNNLAERILRGVMFGRKNYWGNHSFLMGEFSSAMFSIVQTCLLRNISPRKFLPYYFVPLENEIISLFPRDLPKEIAEKLKFP